MYLKKIDQMVSQSSEKNANRSVLAQPLFVITVGRMSAARRNAIRDALAVRWQSTRRYINLCYVDLDADRMSFDKSEHENLREVFLNIKSGTNDEKSKAQLSWWLFQLQSFVAKELGSLDGSHICVICDGESEDAQWAANCCMMLNLWIGISGASVSSRKFFCFLPEAPVSHVQQMTRIKALCDSWRASVPTDPMVVSFKDGKPNLPLRSANSVYPVGVKSVFDRYVFLDAFDTAQQICGDNTLIPILMLLLDPVLELKWPGERGETYSAYLYPKYANRGIDVALTWRCLHGQYISDCGCALSNLNLKEVNQRILSELGSIAANIPAGLTGFTLHSSAKFREFIRDKKNKLTLTNVETMVFGDVLKNKFDYIWRRELNRVRESFLIAWREGIREQLGRVRDENLLQHKAKLYIDYQLQPVQGNPAAAVERARSSKDLQNLIFSIGRFCYHEACQAKIDQFLQELNDEIDEMVKERAKRIGEVKARANMDQLGADVNNAVNAYSNQLGAVMANANQIIAERSNTIQNTLLREEELYNGLYSQYIRAIDAPDSEYQDRISDVLEAVFDSFDQNWLSQIVFPEPAVANCKVACRGVPVGTMEQDYVIDQITSGRSAGMYYYLMKISTNTISALNCGN